MAARASLPKTTPRSRKTARELPLTRAAATKRAAQIYIQVAKDSNEAVPAWIEDISRTST